MESLFSPFHCSECRQEFSSNLSLDSSPILLNCSRLVCRKCCKRRLRKQINLKDRTSCYRTTIAPYLLIGTISELAYHRNQAEKQKRMTFSRWVPPPPTEITSLHCSLCNTMYSTNPNSPNRAVILKCGHDLCQNCFVTERAPENSNLFTRLHLFSNKEKFTVWCKSCRNDTMGNSGEPMAQLATEVIDYLVRSRKMIRNSIHPLHFEELCPQIERNPMDPFSKYCSISCVERVKGQKVTQMVAINSPKAPKFIKRAAKRQ